MIRQYHPVTCPTDGISQTAVTLLISNACDDSTLIASSSLLPFLSPYAPVSHFTLSPPFICARPLLLQTVISHMYTPTLSLLTGLARTGPWHGWPAPLAGTRGPRFRLRPQRLNPSDSDALHHVADSDALHRVTSPFIWATHRHRAHGVTPHPADHGARL